jgi:hypothetical protein
MLFYEQPRALGQLAVFRSCSLYDEACNVFGHIARPAFIYTERDDFERSVILAAKDALDDGCFSRDGVRLDVGVAMLAEVAEDEVNRFERWAE